MPLNPAAQLAENIFDLKTLEQKPTRDGYGKGVVAAGEKDERIVVLCAVRSRIDDHVRAVGVQRAESLVDDRHVAKGATRLQRHVAGLEDALRLRRAVGRGGVLFHVHRMLSCRLPAAPVFELLYA